MMGQQQITLQLPDDLYERMKKVADDNNRPLQVILVESLDLLFGGSTGLDTRLTELEGFADEQLLALVHRRMSWAESERLHELNERNKEASLNQDEQEELEHLLARVDRDLLLRSEALRLLRERGHSVERFFAPTL